MKVIDSMWFNTLHGHFGIVIGKNETTGERKLYAGVVIGLDQKADEQAILDWGSKVNLGMLEGLIAQTKKSEEACDHDWIKLRNEVITSGEICTKCKAVRPESV